MFSQASLILSTGGGCVWQTSPRQTSLPGRHPPGQTPPRQTPHGQTPPLPSACWDTPPPPTSSHCSRWHASYWNAFLLKNMLSTQIPLIENKQMHKQTGLRTAMNWNVRSTNTGMKAKNFYRPPTKLREGNVFTDVCHSLQGRGPVWPVWPLLVTSGDHHSRPVQSCSLQDHSVPTPGGYWTTYSWCKRVDHILLECFVVSLHY